MMLVGLLLALSGCATTPKSQAGAQAGPRGAAQAGPPAVDVAIARPGSLQRELVYTGTTLPMREVLLRSQVEGRLLELEVDVGDPVVRGQTLARLDGAVLESAVVQAEAELAARESEVASAQTEVSDARTRVEQARLELQQAQADAARFQKLAQQGAITTQEAEQSQTAARTAEQALRSTEEQVRTRQREVEAAQRRVVAQQAVLEQQRERRSYTVLTSPITGFVLERLTESGNLVQAGSSIVRLGDFIQVKVVVQVSELELANIRLGQPVQVQLDALPDRQIRGKVNRISPAADPTARLVPVEVTIPNVNRQIGSGLLARVNFARRGGERVIIPETALAAGEESRRKPSPGGDRPASGNRKSSDRRSGAPRSATLFVLVAGDTPRVSARSVQLGNQADGQVEVLSGLKPGESFVARSGAPLKDGDVVRLSVLSERPEKPEK